MTSQIILSEQSARVEAGTPLETFDHFCSMAILQQRGVMWWIGDLALALERQHKDVQEQAWPIVTSPELVARCKAVAAAYPPEDRNPDATWTVHMHLAGRSDRVAAVGATVDEGQTSDEVRDEPPVQQDEKPTGPPKWLLAADVNYFIHTYYHSGAGVESAKTFVEWIRKLATRLSETKGLTDLVCCFDSTTNHRKKLTDGWKHPYKPRTEKEPDLVTQLELVQVLLKEANIPVVSQVGMEADDVMASYAATFPGKVTLLTGDKDMRQCLSGTCNILQSATWEEDDITGKMRPVYKWVSAKSHTDDGSTYNSTKIVGITPQQWPHFQALVGDSVDGIKGCDGIGAKGAMNLILAHDTVQGVIAACKDGNAELSDRKRLSVLDFEEEADLTLALTTLVTDLEVSAMTTLCLTEESG